MPLTKVIQIPNFFCSNQLVGDSTLDPLYFNVMLFGVDTHHCVEDKGCRENTAAT